MDPAEIRWKRLISYLNEYCHLPLQREDVARLLNVSADHVTYLFRVRAGESFPAYLNRLRVERACRLLASGTLSVKEVAHQCGFCNSSYFIKVFRRFTGNSPGRLTGR
ncbi:MAG: AraC family transcriptional regulator [Lentisphaerae bacterium]|nr:MAG: AraC family transcriptional regulator [Lentisphaerota bacterium]